MEKRNLVILLLGFLFFSSFVPKKETRNLVEIHPRDSLKEIVGKSTLVTPNELQYEWQKMEFIAFIHFGPNTFNRVEWGTGKEDPAVFNPIKLDASQWISTIKAAGMKMAMITAKHHDGFCLWPSKTTKHSVVSSPWKAGKGDVLSDLTKAAAKEGIKIGVYLSPADLHEIERENGTYGNGSVPKKVKIPSDPELQKKAKKVFEFELDDYNTLFMNQLYEVLTQYGPVYEVWFDGANPKPGTGQTYNHEVWYSMIRELQPMAAIAIKGPDVRWCGNEAGHTRQSEWSVLPLSIHPKKNDWADAVKEDLGTREKMKGAKFLYWYPAETNTSIRSGWFYRDENQYVKTVDQLVDTWYRSVGGNTVFLLNLTPDRRGLIPDTDASRLKEVGQIISESFRTNLVKNSAITTSNEVKGFSAKKMNDGNLESFWKPNDGIETPEIVIELKNATEFNRLVLQEDIRSSGQRIEKFAVDIYNNGKWHEICQGTTVGYKNIRRFPMVKTMRVRVRILGSRICPTLAEIGLYKASEMLSNPSIVRTKGGMVALSCSTPDPEIFYTLDGTTPDKKSTCYEKPFALPRGGVVKAIAMVDGGNKKSEIVEFKFDFCSEKWIVVSTTDAQKGFSESNAIDGLSSTMWYTPLSGKVSTHPHVLSVDLGETINLRGFTYLPRTDRSLAGVCKSYRFEVSTDGKNWVLVKDDSFSNIKNNPVLQEVFFEKSFMAKFIRFTSLSTVNDDPFLSMAEIGIITR